MDPWQKTTHGALPPALPLRSAPGEGHSGPGPWPRTGGGPGSPLTGGSCAIPRCAVAGSEGSLRCPGSSRAGGNAAAPARHSRWPQGHRLCCGDRQGDQSGLGYQTQTPSIGRLVPMFRCEKILTSDPCPAAKAQASVPLCGPSLPFWPLPCGWQLPKESF